MHSRAHDRNFRKNFGRSEKTLLSSGWTLIGSELSSPNFNSSVRAERSFAIRYLNVVIKPLCGNLDICLNYYFRSRNSVRVLSIATESERCFFFGSRFSVALLRNLAEKLEHANAPIDSVGQFHLFCLEDSELLFNDCPEL